MTSFFRHPLSRGLLAWISATALACLIVHHAFALTIDEAHPLAVVATVWSEGKVVSRAVLAHPGEADAALDAALAAHPGAIRVDEAVVADGPVIGWPPFALALSVVSGHDGLSASQDGRTAYLTPDELLALQAYDRGLDLPGGIGMQIGLDGPLALGLLADRLGTTANELTARGRIRRIRVVRSEPGAPPPRVITADTMTDDDVRAAAIEAGRYLGRGVDDSGRFRYLVDAPSNRTLPGYDWPRHAGATYFLAQAAALSHDPDLSWAALRAAGWLRDHAMVDCGPNRCIGDGRVVDVGSTALTVIAFVEIAQTNLDPGYALVVPGLTAFLRAQQRPDGEFMHEYDRNEGRAIDVQLLYYSGEAALALSRAHTLLGDSRDLDASSRAVARLVGPGWHFFGSRYYFGEEHWTCQAMDELWDRAPNPGALDFCLRWHAYGRKLQYGPDDTAFDADGAYGVSPVITPRLTPVGSRSEAGIATLEAARRAGVPAEEQAILERQMRRSLAVLLRHQFRPGPRHLFAVPAAVEGAMPGSEVDWQLRIDFAQHAGCALLRWLSLGAARQPERAREREREPAVAP